LPLSTSETERGGRWLFVAIALLLAFLYPGTLAIDGVAASFVVLVPACAGAAAIARGRHLFVILAFLVTLMAFILLTPTGESRAIFAGLLCATILAASTHSHLRGRRLALPIAAVVSLIGSTIIRLIPIDAITSGSILGIVIAVAAVVVLSSEGEVRVPVPPFAILLALIVPHEPLRAVLFAGVVLLSLVLVRFWSLPLLAIVVVLSAIANPWALAMPLAALAGAAFDRRQSGELAMFAAPTLVISRAFLPLLIFASEFPRRVSRGAAGAILLILVATVAPAGVASLLVAGAIGMCLLDRRDDEVGVAAAIPVAWSLYILANFHSSGALASLLVPVRDSWMLAALLFVGLIVMLVARKSNRLAALMLSAVLLLVVDRTVFNEGVFRDLLNRKMSLEEVDRSLPAGASTEVELEGNVREIEIELSAANLPQFSPSTEIGSIEWLDGAGGGHRVAILAGQLADWGAYRREDRWRTRRALPWDAYERVEGFGSEAFVVGSGVVSIDEGKWVRRVKVDAASTLPPATRLHFVGFRIID